MTKAPAKSSELSVLNPAGQGVRAGSDSDGSRPLAKTSDRQPVTTELSILKAVVRKRKKQRTEWTLRREEQKPPTSNFRFLLIPSKNDSAVPDPLNKAVQSRNAMLLGDAGLQELSGQGGRFFGRKT